MAWSAPFTAVTGQVLTAAQWNTYVRDNLNMCAPAIVTQSGQMIVASGPNQLAARTPGYGLTAALETTSSASFTDLTTIGPQCTLTTGTSALIFISVLMAMNTVAAYAIAGYDVAGASTIAATTASSVNFRAGATNQQFRGTFVDLLTTLTPGINTFTMRYIGNGGTATFGQRTIFVLPFS